ncbi:MFS transporter [Aquabacterium sp. J223]|uniref:MFS transporter n=1 Tax=Aquabacterium sp. J223 TaxID=2898431 RepID=UPI0021ADD2F5|nr:MFS transporter [Aquabacterium sp. J223]UUX94659.1 MFS transporter [Aquabacterium sp. J223]
MPLLSPPLATVTPDRLARGQQDLVRDLAWASVAGAFSGGVILVAFALSLGAGPLAVGLLAAIPVLAQAAQLPATLLIERVRRRQRIAVLALTAARGLILATALLPLLASPAQALRWLLALQVAIALLHAVGACAVNAWLHQLIPGTALGGFFARRLLWGTVLSCVGTLAAGALVDGLGSDLGLHPYSLCFLLAGLSGFVSSFYLARAPEPCMADAGPLGSLRRRLAAPFRERNFRRLLVFLGAWNLASNLTAPFLTVFLLQQLRLPLSTVTGLWVLSQGANALTLYLWGRLSDRLTNKAVLSVALPGYFACLLALVFVDVFAGAATRLAVLAGLHLVMGVATGGIALATGNLGLKLAPQGEGTAFLAAIGLVSAAAGGLAPIAAGAMAEALQASELSAVVRWASPGAQGEWAVVSFAHWEFLFALSVLLGLYVMHALSRVTEGREVSERVVMQEFALEAVRTVGSLSSVAGSLGSLFPFERLTERRRRLRERAVVPEPGWQGRAS